VYRVVDVREHVEEEVIEEDDEAEQEPLRP
jgi:hypothetical protein